MASTSTPRPSNLVSNNVLQSQNTAPVLEFRCLFTSDLRRKQKRWQDGRLKFHTFNKRVMVYDERSNFVGDTHWKEDYNFDEGEELELERGGVLIQVADCIGRKDQDLTELLDKRVKEREERVAARIAASSPLLTPQPTTRIEAATHTALPPHTRQKSLSALLTPSGHHGRALVSTSTPFEQRQLANMVSTGESSIDRPPKRRKGNLSSPNKGGYAQSLMGATLILSSGPQSSAPMWLDPLRAVTSRPQRNAETIDLTSSPEESRPSHPVRVLDSEQNLERPAKTKMDKAMSSKQGYAKNITGATLTLSTTPRSQTKPVARFDGVKSRTDLVITDTEVASKNDFVDIDSLEDDDRSAYSAAALQRVVEPQLNMPQRQGLRALPAISTKTPQPPSKTVSMEKRKQPSVLITANEQPSQPLRIKSRRKRSMLMSYSRPSTLSSASFEREMGSSTLQNNLLVDAWTENHLSSQAQMKRLQASLREKHKIDGDEGISSPPDDIGIGYTEIDALLSKGCARLQGADKVDTTYTTKLNILENPDARQLVAASPMLPMEPELSTKVGRMSCETLLTNPSNLSCSEVEHMIVDSSNEARSEQSFDLDEDTSSMTRISVSSILQGKPRTMSGPDDGIIIETEPLGLGAKDGNVMAVAEICTPSNKAIPLDTGFGPKRSPKSVRISAMIDKSSRPKEMNKDEQLGSKIDEPVAHAIDQLHELPPLPTSESDQAPVNPLKTTLVNPATRGRKAAQKGDSAGRMPQLVVPVVAHGIVGLPIAPVQRQRSGGITSNPRATVTEPIVAEELGPWSKEAQDLFDWKKPNAAAATS